MEDPPEQKGNETPAQSPDAPSAITISFQEFGKIMDLLATIVLQVKAIEKTLEEHKRQIVELEKVAEKAKRYLG